MAKKSAPRDGAKSRAVIVSPTPVEPLAPQPSAFQNALGAAGRAAAATASGMGAGMAEGARNAGRMAGSLGQAAADAGGKAALALGDLNGDGKVDEVDFHIAREATMRAAAVAGREAGELGKAVMRHEMTKDAAAGAAIGALIAVPIPFVGPPVGAALGAAVGLTRGALSDGVLTTVAGHMAAAVNRPKPRRAPVRRKPKA